MSSMWVYLFRRTTQKRRLCVCVFVLMSLVAFINLWENTVTYILLKDDYFIPRKLRVTPLDFEFTTSASQCEQTTRPLMVVIVLTVHKDVARRRAIRETWGSVVKSGRWLHDPLPWDVKVIFLLGHQNNLSKSEQIRKENEEFQDIVESSFDESYFNLTYKVLMGFKWVQQFCPRANFIVKVDIDIFMNLKLLMHLLQTRDFSNHVFGPDGGVSQVYREDKYSVKPEMYPFRLYPKHVKGHFYVMPRELAMRILRVSEYMPYVNMEDVHITGILLGVVGGGHIYVPVSMYDHFKRKSPKPCEFVNTDQLVGQKVYPILARALWQRLANISSCD